ncbi:hypothetical protein MTsPCn9_34580 [Croceitalea sp. MTPC9]|uniref:hypothetical protein n=1 Tax=unclassified Croceitalea TaxID=2632280 RepID=UPI002B38BA37|nr:hypothetical protein MTsPCn6_34370 [Croceitalea sp. MTPC6]GMN18518.1 hypothetical protein MTsPCn9_34580 [Croceitalea sp. MTPC9]
MDNLTHDNFDSHDLLYELDKLDAIRYSLAEIDLIKPPQVRQDLHRLHGLVFDALNYKDKVSREEIEELLDDVKTVIDEIRDNAESISEKLAELETALYKIDEEE